MPATGTLTCCANDVPDFYWNNCGTISLSIERLPNPDDSLAPAPPTIGGAETSD